MKHKKVEMKISWKTGRPNMDGDYVVVVKTYFGYVAQLHFTVKYGWNTFNDHPYSSFNDADIAAWTEPFAEHVIDICEQMDIIKEKEVDSEKSV